MRKTISEPAREIPVAAEADVVVCGGGPGGVPAAIAAARHGAKVVLIERYGFMGGLATAGLVAPILAHKAHAADFAIVEGILREITERMHALGGAPGWEESLKEWGINFDAECLKFVLDEMCQEAGVVLLLHSYIAEVAMRDGRIAGVVVENKSGRQAVVGTLFVDATGDADVAFRAGAPTTHGREWDGRPESMGSFIHLAGFAYPDETQRKEIVARVQDEMAAGRLRFYNPGFLNRNAHHTDHSSANMTRFGGDPNSAADMTRAELGIRRDAWALVRFLRAHAPGFEDCYVQQLSPQVGPRESRQIVGPYALNGDDIHLGRKYPDAIARGSWWIDIHCPLGHTYPVHLCRKECPKGTDCPFFAAEYERMRAKEELYPPEGDWYDIPYRCLLSVGVPNLLSSGRCISATHEGMAGSRVMGTCVALGQAAGTAAALALSQGVEPAKLDISSVRQALTRDGQLV
jgi:hypothetical protein